MKRNHLFYAFLLALVSLGMACNNEGEETPGETSEEKIREEPVSYSTDSLNFQGYVAYNESSDAKRPIVVIVPEWWGVTDYVKRRARELAGLGYISIVADMYGNGRVADNPDSAGKWATPFYQYPLMAQKHFDAALDKVKTYPQADTSKAAAIGYCFGGAMVLNMARLGENLAGVVSFHGNLVGVPPVKDLLKAKILVCHGEADPFIKPEEVALFKKQLDDIGASYTFKSYPGALHAFTNPDATANGEKFKLPIKYDAAADSASWQDMKAFLRDVLK